jgi:preprotein translocase subunit SecG
MATFYNVLLIVAVLVAVLFSALVFITGKGDAMSSGGSGVRTTFKGKASFDDQISRVTFGMGVGFMVLMVVLDFLSHRISK